MIITDPVHSANNLSSDFVNGLVDHCDTDMKVLDLKKIRDWTPFRAFQLHLTNGETLPIRHPKCLAMPPEPGVELFVIWVGADWNLVDAGQVARGEFAEFQDEPSEILTSLSVLLDAHEP
jgi:hypothetical protein